MDIDGHSRRRQPFDLRTILMCVYYIQHSGFQASLVFKKTPIRGLPSEDILLIQNILSYTQEMPLTELYWLKLEIQLYQSLSLANT